MEQETKRKIARRLRRYWKRNPSARKRQGEVFRKYWESRRENPFLSVTTETKTPIEDYEELSIPPTTKTYCYIKVCKLCKRPL